MGFGLENYDVLGLWRTEDAGKPIDAKGELPDGTKFDGPVEMKQILMNQKDLLIRNLTSKLLGYALQGGFALPQNPCKFNGLANKLDNAKNSWYKFWDGLDGIHK